ncbi:uncharacterized protein LOC124667112 [Lolium rigidum]|uniref:uncharacterized protein LOC124667112 n=1 Tax=Lolium rigidum TaxID=89674 RepID=UPI001F5DBA0F|nr:uncharacterized protein LOC124667112 [Lolium rigidum]
MRSLRPAALLAVAAVWLWWSAAVALADNGTTTACLCTGPQCFPPCPTTPQFPFCPPQPPPSLVPFPWQSSSSPKSGEFIPQEPGFLAAAATWRGRTAAAWMQVGVVASAFLVLLR